jgi:hypothetical protein
MSDVSEFSEQIERIRAACSQQNFDEALVGLNALLKQNPHCPFLWNFKGDLIQLAESSPQFTPKDAENSYKRALDLNPADLEAMESLAHFYDAVEPNADEAKRHANKFIEALTPKLAAMQRIVAE